jgi:hypothetical protein
MRTLLSLLLVSICAVMIAGCAAPAGGVKPGATPAAAARLSQADHDAVVAGEDEFLKVVAASKYNLIKSVVLPSQAAGFDAQAFVESRFRMKTSEFVVAGWDMNAIGVTAAKTKGDVLTSCVVGVRVYATNESRPVVINLIWRKDGGRWWLVPFPEAG